ncbi:hypothetical protein [Flavobacterium sp.]|uniref:hypothetical protein n=1 Tax=Flavobacterium sp. TaxID=239 RepID=UPI0040485C1F
MKRLLSILSLFLILNSCSVDEGEKYHLTLLPIEEVVVPDSFQLDQTYSIKVKYKKPTTCHVYDGIYYDRNENIRTFAVQNVVYERSECQDITTATLTEATFDFRVLNTGSYIFKFWQGTDANGENMYLEVEIPVVD